ncbi:hypothetical protein [Kineococcus sp. SYSU DK018]
MTLLLEFLVWLAVEVVQVVSGEGFRSRRRRERPKAAVEKESGVVS